MVSRLPTFALKGWRITPKWIAPIMVLAVLLVAAAITNPWLTLSCIGSVYFLSLPCAYYAYRRRQKNEGNVNA
jgi:CDP-diacylglycerol--serine O-phosphatidyltransferase